jgi:hypothetical protein
MTRNKNHSSQSAYAVLEAAACNLSFGAASYTADGVAMCNLGGNDSHDEYKLIKSEAISQFCMLSAHRLPGYAPSQNSLRVVLSGAICIWSGM